MTVLKKEFTREQGRELIEQFPLGPMNDRCGGPEGCTLVRHHSGIHARHYNKEQVARTWVLGD